MLNASHVLSILREIMEGDGLCWAERTDGRNIKCIVLVAGYGEERRPAAVARCRWEGNVKTDLM